eukprot:scaffold455_cov116-Isochrysis_galbana.AAC.3
MPPLSARGDEVNERYSSMFAVIDQSIHSKMRPVHSLHHLRSNQSCPHAGSCPTTIFDFQFGAALCIRAAAAITPSR